MDISYVEFNCIVEELEKREKRRIAFLQDNIKRGCDKCSQFDDYWGCNKCYMVCEIMDEEE